MQIPGLNDRGVTTLEQHEALSWPIAVSGATVPVKPVLAGISDIVVYLKKIRDNRRD